MDGWMTCDFTPFLTVFQSYQDDVWMIMKGCVQWNSVYGWEDFTSSEDRTRSARSPVGIWCQNDVVSTSMRRDHVASTLIRRHFHTKCPLGSVGQRLTHWATGAPTNCRTSDETKHAALCDKRHSTLNQIISHVFEVSSTSYFFLCKYHLKKHCWSVIQSGFANKVHSRKIKTLYQKIGI